MLKSIYFLILILFLVTESYQQATVTNPQSTINNQIPTPKSQTQVSSPFQKFDDILLRNLQEQQQNEVEIEMEDRMRYQIFIWTCIGLVFVSYFTIMALIEMPNPKSSILYAKYDTTRAEHELN